MKLYSYVKKGIAHRNGVCEDTVLADKTISKGEYLMVDLNEYFFAGVADGVGGRSSGEVASGFTMLRLAQMDAESMTLSAMRERLEEINVEIRKLSRNNEAFNGMASTLTLFGKVKDGTFVANLGNSRLYQCVEWGGVKQLSLETTDHNLLNDWIRFGEPDGMSIEDIKDTPKAGMLTSYMGMDEEIFKRKLEFEELDLSRTKRVLITSDGVHDYLSYEDIKKFICSESISENMLIRLAQKAIDVGSKDDLSIVVIEDL